MFVGAILAGFGLMFISQATSLATFYGSFALVAIGTSACSGVVFMTAVANWFHKKIGLATSITISGIGLGSLMIPFIVKLIDIFQWKAALFVLGLGFFVLISPLAFVLRHRPEHYGYSPDGEETGMIASIQVQNREDTSQSDVGAKQAFRNRAFWHITLALTLQYLAYISVITHIMPYLGSIGITRSTSGLIATAIPIISIGGHISSGWLSDKFNKRRVIAVYCAVIFIGFLLFSYIPNAGIWLFVPGAIFIGIGWGSHNTIRATLTREYFGRRSFGTILGFMAGFVVIIGIVGPPFAGWIFDNAGNYQAAWLIFAFCLFLALIIVVTIPPVDTKTK
jgi:cyanate permease